MSFFSEMDQDANFVASELACMIRLQVIEILIDRDNRMYIFVFGKTLEEPTCGCQIRMVEMASRSLDSIIETYFDVLVDLLDGFGEE